MVGTNPFAKKKELPLDEPATVVEFPAESILSLGDVIGPIFDEIVRSGRVMLGKPRVKRSARQGKPAVYAKPRRKRIRALMRNVRKQRKRERKAR